MLMACDNVLKRNVSTMVIAVLMLTLLFNAGATALKESTVTTSAEATPAPEAAAAPESSPEVFDGDFLTDNEEIPVTTTCEICPCIGSTMDCDSQGMHAFLMKTTISNVIKLELGHNRLEELAADSFSGLPNLRYLTISDNYIATVDEDAFKGLTILERLDISQNAVATLPMTVLTGHSKLQRLYISRNRLTDVSFLMHIRNCSLQTVEVRMNSLARLPVRTFGHCSYLREIWLDGNKISEIDEEAFEGLIHLTTLDLSSNRLSQIAPTTFHPLKVLRVLDMSRNQLVSIDGGLFETLTSLRALYLPFNWLREIPAGVFSTCTYLRRVILSDNLIEFVDPDAFTSTPSQDLPQHRVTHPKCVSLVNRTANVAVKYLDLSHNHLRKVPVGALMSFPNIEELNLESNLITTFGSDVVCLAGALKNRLLFSGNRLVCTCGPLYDAFRLSERVAPDFQPECLHSKEPWVVLKGRRCKEAAAAASASAAHARLLMLGPPTPPQPSQPVDNGLHAAVVAPILAVAFVLSLTAMAVSVFRRYRRATFEVPQADPASVRMTLYAPATSFTAMNSRASAESTSRL